MSRVISKHFLSNINAFDYFRRKEVGRSAQLKNWSFVDSTDVGS